MTEARTDQDWIEKTHNLARYCMEARQVSWVFLIGTLIWGFFSYQALERRRDPFYTNVYAVAYCQWPGASAEKVEQLVTRKLEEKIAENMKVSEIKSTSRSNISFVLIKLDERVKDSNSQFDDLALRLQNVQGLPDGAGPVVFQRDFAEITTLMLTVASPPASEVEISLRAEAIKGAIEKARPRSPPGKRISLVVCFPASTPPEIPRRQRDLFARYCAKHGFLKDIKTVEGSGFVGVDALSDHTDEETRKFTNSFVFDCLKVDQLHPDLWLPAIIHNPGDTKARLTEIAGDKYSYKELDAYTDLITRTLHTLPQVARITRTGVLDEQINLEFSQERLASYGVQPVDLKQRLQARNIQMPGGVLEVGNKVVRIDPSGAFKSEKEIGSVLVTTSQSGAPVYLRDLVDISRGYQSPARFLNFLTWRDAKGNWHRTRAITLSINMRTEENIDKFAEKVNATLEALKQRLPDDLILCRTADQPKLVEDNIELFMNSLYEAIGLVVITALIGFWEWRSALLIALSIPTTLAMTFGMMKLLNIDLQQCSISSLIIALGLLVDDPVVAGDAIKRCLASGHSALISAWLGPTKLSHAIMYATITNIAAYVPLLLVSGTLGQFLYSLPVVITCSLIASRIASMTFVPLLGYYLLRPPKQKAVDPDSLGQRIVRGYMAIGHKVLDMRLLVFAIAVVLLIGGFMSMSKIRTAFFPDDEFNLCWVDVWLPEDSPLSATNDVCVHVEELAKQVATEYGKEHPEKDGKPRDILQWMTAFTGGGGPRFWSTLLPELNQLNYAQILVELNDKHDTAKYIKKLQVALNNSVPEARCDVRALEAGTPVGIPVALRVSGRDQEVLRETAAKVAKVMEESPLAERVRDDWGSGTVAVHLNVNSDKANMVGLSNADVAGASATGLSGYQMDVMREGDKQIPIVLRLRSEESAQIQKLSDLYVYSTNTTAKIPLPAVATMDYSIEPEKIIRRNQFRTITVACFPVAGVLASEVMENIRPQIDKLKSQLPPGYTLEVGGSEDEQVRSFIEMGTVMAVSISAIFLCLVIQFKNAVKPFLVFAGLPYGFLGALLALEIMDQPFGFSAFMGVASLAGVIVSHVIVLFDFIEEGREEGMELRDALLKASMVRLRPVVITVAATVLGFLPLAAHGGPLWQPLCYAQIGGLTLATFSTLGLVPIIYAIAVLDLKLIKWEDS